MSSSRKLLGQSPPTQPKTKSAPPLRKRTEPVLQSSPLRSDSQGKRCHPLGSFSDSHLQLNQKQSPRLRSESEWNLFSNLHRCARTAKGNVVILSEASRTVTSNSTKDKVRTSAQKANGNCYPIFTAALGQPRETLSSSRKLLGQSPPTQPKTKSAPPLRKRTEPVLQSSPLRSDSQGKRCHPLGSFSDSHLQLNQNKVRASAQKANGTCSPIFTAALGQPRETLSSSRKLLGQSPPTQPKTKSAPPLRKRTEPVIQSSPLRSDSQGKRCHPLGSFSDSHRQLNDKKSPHLCSESERTCSPIFTAALGQPRETLSSSRKLLGQSPSTQRQKKSAPPLRKRIETCYPIFTAALGQPRETLSSSQKLLGQSPPTQPKTKSAPPLRKRTEPVLQSAPLRSDSQGKRCHPLGSFSDSHLQLNQRQSPHLRSESERKPVSQSSPPHSDSQGKRCHPLGSFSDSPLQLNQKQSPHLRSESERNLFSNLHRCARTAKGKVGIVTANYTTNKSAPLFRKRTEPVSQSSPLRSDSQGKRCHPVGSFSDSHRQLNDKKSPHLCSKGERNLFSNLHRRTRTAKGNVVILSEASRTVTSNSTKNKVRTSAQKSNRNLLSNLHRCTRTAKGNVVILSEASRTVTSNSTKTKVRTSVQKANGTCSPIFTAALGQPRETLSSSQKLLGQSAPTQPKTKSAPPLRKRIETCSPIFTAALGQPRETLSSSRKLLGQSPPTHRCARTAKGNVVILSEASGTVTSDSTKTNVRTSAQKANRNLLSNLHRCTRTAKGNVVILSEASRQSPPTQRQTKSAPLLRKRKEPVLQERKLFSNLHRSARTAKGNVVILSEASRTVTANSTTKKVRTSAQKANGTCSPIFTAALGQPRETLSSSRKLLGQSPPTQQQTKSAPPLRKRIETCYPIFTAALGQPRETVSSSRKLLGQSPPTQPQTKSAPPLRKRIETCSPIFTAALGQPRETLSSSRKLLGQSPPTQPKTKSSPPLRKRTEPVLQSSPLHSDSQGKRCDPLGSFSDSHRQLNDKQSPHLC